MTEISFDSFRLIVLQSESLQSLLREISEKNSFIEQVVKLGAAHGYNFTAETVQAALQSNRRAWIERWIR